MPNLKKMQSQLFFIVILNICGLTLGRFCDDSIAKYFRYDNCGQAVVLRIPNDYSGSYTLEANLSFFRILSHKIDPTGELINWGEMQSHPVDNLLYGLKYEWPACVPEFRVTSVVFNGKILCQENLYNGTSRGDAFTFIHTIQAENQRYHSKPPFNNFQNGYGNNQPSSLQFNPRPSPPHMINQYEPNYNQKYPSSWTEIPYHNNPPEMMIEDTTPSFQSNPNQNRDCGSANDDHLNLIHGGNLAVKGDFPWTVALFLRNGLGNKDKYICTGNQLSDRHVLTAAHCIEVKKQYLFVVPGIIHLDTVSSETKYDIDKIDMHPNYTARLPSHDMAILTLTRKVSGVPVCLWPSDINTRQFVGKKGVVLGWGRYSKNVVEPSKWLKFIEFPIVSQETCFFSDNRFRILITQDTFCAGDRSMNGPCSGDSGGGFNMKIDGRYYLRGIVSTSVSKNGTCDLSQYVLFTDLATHLNWVNEILAL